MAFISDKQALNNVCTCACLRGVIVCSFKIYTHRVRQLIIGYAKDNGKNIATTLIDAGAPCVKSRYSPALKPWSDNSRVSHDARQCCRAMLIPSPTKPLIPSPSCRFRSFPLFNDSMRSLCNFLFTSDCFEASPGPSSFGPLGACL